MIFVFFSKTAKKYWKEWQEFEVRHGNEDTFREMLRIKRSVQAQYNTQVRGREGEREREGRGVMERRKGEKGGREGEREGGKEEEEGGKERGREGRGKGGKEEEERGRERGRGKGREGKRQRILYLSFSG